LLIEKGADTSIKNDHGVSAAEIADKLKSDFK